MQQPAPCDLFLTVDVALLILASIEAWKLVPLRLVSKRWKLLISKVRAHCLYIAAAFAERVFPNTVSFVCRKLKSLPALPQLEYLECNMLQTDQPLMYSQLTHFRLAWYPELNFSERASNRISFHQFVRLTTLQRLYIKPNRDCTDAHVLTSLSTLDHIDLNYSQYLLHDFLSSLVQLRSVYAPLTGWLRKGPFPHLHTLKTFVTESLAGRVGAQSLLTDLPQLLPALQSLSIAFSYPNAEEGVSLTHLTAIRSLSLQILFATLPLHFINLPQLEQLALYDIDFPLSTDPTWKDLAASEKLTQLRWKSSTQADFSCLFQRMPKLKHLHFPKEGYYGDTINCGWQILFFFQCFISAFSDSSFVFH